MTFSLGYVEALFLLSARNGAALWLMPAFNLQALPAAGRLAMAVALSAAALPAGQHEPFASDARFGFAIVTELLLGVVLGFVVNTAFAAIRSGGAMLDNYLGLGMAAMIDPAGHNERSSPTEAFSNVLATALFFGANVHLQVLWALHRLVEVLPPGSWTGALNAANVIGLGANLFEVAVRLTLPLLAISFVTDAALALASRMVPQLQPIFLGAPVKSAVGLGALALSLPVWGAAVLALFDTLPSQMAGLLAR